MKATLLLLESTMTVLVNMPGLLRVLMGFRDAPTVFTVDLEPRSCHVQGNAVQSIAPWRACAKWDSAQRSSSSACHHMSTLAGSCYHPRVLQASEGGAGMKGRVV